MNSLKTEIIKELFEIDCFQFGSFTLKSGIVSPFYLNLRNIISKPSLLKKLSKLIYETLIHIDNDCTKNVIVGLPYAGIPYANTISVLYDIPLLLLRKEKKKYGNKTLIEGLTSNTKNLDLIIIDDIITTGSSINESIPHLKTENLQIKKIITIIDRRNTRNEIKNINNIKNIENIKIESVFHINEIFDILKESNLITRKKYDTVISFVSNN